MMAHYATIRAANQLLNPQVSNVSAHQVNASDRRAYRREWWREKGKALLTANPEKREKQRAACRKHHRKNRTKLIADHRRRILQKLYGISESQYDELLKAQNNGCAICGSVTSGRGRLDVDHDHETKKVRGLLCSNCNNGLGRFKDSIESLEKAIQYLRKEG